MAIYEIAQGDLGTMLVDLTDLGVADDVSDATGALTMRWYKPDGSYNETHTVTNVNLATGSVSVIWGAGDTDVPGVHRAQFVVPRPEGPESYPTDGTWFRWIVRAKLSPAS